MWDKIVENENSNKQERQMKQFNFKVLYKNWWVHNIVAHPLMQILYSLGFIGLSDALHDATLQAAGSPE